MKRDTFAYDVVVNVLANLVAALVLYILGVALGLLPVNVKVVVFLLATSVAGGVGTTVWIIRRVAYGPSAQGGAPDNKTSSPRSPASSGSVSTPRKATDRPAAPGRGQRRGGRR
jgi:hypothetical protein